MSPPSPLKSEMVSHLHPLDLNNCACASCSKEQNDGGLFRGRVGRLVDIGGPIRNLSLELANVTCISEERSHMYENGAFIVKIIARTAV